MKNEATVHNQSGVPMTADEAKQKVLKVHPKAWWDEGDGIDGAVWNGDVIPRNHLGETWLDAASKLLPIPARKAKLTSLQMAAIYGSGMNMYFAAKRVLDSFTGGRNPTEAQLNRLSVCIEGFEYHFSPDKFDEKEFESATPSTEESTTTSSSNGINNINRNNGILSTTPGSTEESGEPATCDWKHSFKNFHRSLCERFGYTHDEKDWYRDQASLEEFIAADYLRGKLDEAFNDGVEAAAKDCEEAVNGTSVHLIGKGFAERVRELKRGNS